MSSDTINFERIVAITQQSFDEKGIAKGKIPGEHFTVNYIRGPENIIVGITISEALEYTIRYPMGKKILHHTAKIKRVESEEEAFGFIEDMETGDVIKFYYNGAPVKDKVIPAYMKESIANIKPAISEMINKSNLEQAITNEYEQMGPTKTSAMPSEQFMNGLTRLIESRRFKN